MLTFEEWDRLLAEQEAAKQAALKEVRANPAPRAHRFAIPAAKANAETSAPSEDAHVEPDVEEPAPAAQVPTPAAASAAAPPPPPSEPIREETPLERLLRYCNEDPYDADRCHDLARQAYADKRPDVVVAPLVRTAGLLMSTSAGTAAELLSRLLIMKVDTIHSDLMLAQLCLQQDRMREAEQALQAALRHEPTNHVAFQGMIKVSLAARRPQEAIDYCHHVLGVDANLASVWEQLGDAHAFTANVAQATESWLTAARLFAHQNSITDAIRVYSQIIMVDPEHPLAAGERANLGYTG